MIDPAKYVGQRVRLTVGFPSTQDDGATGVVIKNTTRDLYASSFPYLVRWDEEHNNNSTIWEDSAHDWCPLWKDVEPLERIYTVNKLGNFPKRKEVRHV